MTFDFTGLFHPRFHGIESFATGHASERDRATITVHLRDCVRCQDRVRALRALRATAQDEHVPSMSATLRDRVLSNVRAGERRIIPTVDEVPSATPNRARRHFAFAVAAALVTLIALVPDRGLEAGPTAGTLSIVQKSARPAPHFAVRYVPAATLGGANRVVLKVVPYEAQKPAPAVGRDFTLMRGQDGAFVGDVTLPAGTVFAQYSVASADGTKVDDNDARGWEAAVQDSTSRPLFEGLWIQLVVNEFGNWERSSGAAKAMLQYYPDNPASVRYTMSDERQLAGASRADSIVRLHRPRVEELHRKFATAPLDATTMWEMAMLGSDISDTAMVRHWRQRMIREYPTDASTVQQRVFAVFETRLPKKQSMRELDRIWDESGGQGIQLLANAFDLAVQLDDSAAIARWGERLVKFGGGYESMAATRYVTLPEFRTRGADLLRQSLRSLPSVPVTDWRAALRKADGRSPSQQGKWQLQALGKALLDEGRIDAARDTLRRAASLGWDVKTLRQLGDAELTAGDSAAAMSAYAWVAADSRTNSALGDSLRTRLGSAAHGPKWDSAVADGRALLASRVLMTAIRRPFEAGASFSDAAGTRRSLATAIGKHVSVVAFISRHCAPSLADFASLDAVAVKLAQLDVPVVALVDETPNPSTIAELSKLGFKGYVGFDDRAEVSRSMRQSGTPHYFIVDDGNVIRFDARRAEDLLMLVEALQAKR